MVASVGADAEGSSYNVNADAAAAAVAEALGAFKVVFLTDVEGWRADPGRPGHAASRRPPPPRCASGSPEVTRRDAAEARGVPCTRSSRASGSAHIVDGREPHSLLLELFTDEGIGTKLWP